MATTKTSTNASKPRTAAPKRKPAASRATTGSTPAARSASLAERAVLIPVGAALEARDRVADIVATTRSRSALEKRLSHFERRGGRARAQLERRARGVRRDLERQRTQARRNLSSNVEQFSTRVESVVQNGVNVGIKLVNGAQDRFPRVS
jgi:hypothetical protein